MKSRLGNKRKSRGARNPKPSVDGVRVADGDEILLQRAPTDILNAHHPRAGWAQAAATAAVSLLDSATPTRFDEHEWQW